MNDIATIERALKDADLGIEWLAKGGPFMQEEVASLHDQITAALMLLRQIPGQHSPTTAIRQGFQALKQHTATESRASTLEAAIKRWLESPNTESFNALKRLVNHE